MMMTREMDIISQISWGISKFPYDKKDGGTFLSCFPFDEHFEYLGKNNIEDIKFVDYSKAVIQS